MITDPGVNHRAFRFWPIYSAAFARTFSYNIYNLALPNYLLYIKQIEESFVGLIVAVYALSFVFGPIIALPITKKIGFRNAVIFSSITSVLSVGLQLLFFSPLLLILFRIIDGICTGFYWPNLQMEVSNWQRISPPEKSDQYFQNYAMSWNYGILFGGIAGFIIVFVGNGNEFIALISSWIFMIAMIPSALSIEKPHNKLEFFEGKAIVKFESDLRNGSLLKIADISTMKLENKHSNNSLLLFPAAFYLIGTLIYAYIKAFFPIAVPIIFARENIPSYMVYIITFFNQVLQIIAVTLVTRRSVKIGYYSWFLSMLFNMIGICLLMFFSSSIAIAIVFMMNGVLSGLLYNFLSKIMLKYGSTSSSLKYVSLYELFNGVGFGLSPLIAGYLAEIDMNLNYIVLSVILSIVIIVLVKIGEKGRKSF